jgi:hypothetical protein
MVICVELEDYFLDWDWVFWTLHWCMSYVWVYFDLFGLTWNLVEVGEINKIYVDVLVLFDFELINDNLF